MTVPAPAFVAPTPAALDAKRNPLGVGTAQPRLTVELPTGPVVITVEEVTPETADHWLKMYNTRNRTLYADRAEALSRDMLLGNFVFNGDTVRFSIHATGDHKGEVYLSDGQHRLDAIRKSKTAQLCIVVRGLPDDAQETIDTGKSRSFGDTLRLEGWSNENHIAAVTRALLLWERDIIVGLNSGGTAVGLTTKPELRAYLTEHAEEIRASMKVVYAATGVGLKFAAPSSRLAMAWALCARKDPEAADLFIIENVVQGKRLDDGHPAKALRDRLLRTDVYRPKPAEAFLLTLHAWNIWRDNRQVTRLQPPREWPVPSEFTIR